MKNISFDYFEKTAFLGGIGTGCLKMYSNGKTEFAGLVKNSSRRTNPAEVADPVSFALGVKYDGDENAHQVILRSAGTVVSDTDGVLPYAGIKNMNKSFPFANFEYDSSALEGIQVKLCAFNPAIPQNSVDSGIPAAFFEIEIRNLTNLPATVTVGALLESIFLSGKATVSYDSTSSAFCAELKDTTRRVPLRRRGSLCLSTDAEDFTYEITPSFGKFVLFENFKRNNGFLNNTAIDSSANSIALMISAHERLMPGDSKKVRFLVCWNFPYCVDSNAKDEDKNYYSHYFPNNKTCVSYCFSHFDKLLKESMIFSEIIGEDAFLPEKVKEILNCSFSCIKDPAVRRDSNGVIKGIAEDAQEANSVCFSYILEYLFPGITTKTTISALSELLSAKGKDADTDEFIPTAFDEKCGTKQMCARFSMISRLYNSYRTCSDLRFFSAYWVDLSCMADILCRNAQNLVQTDVLYLEIYSAAISALWAMTQVADILGDKKRKFSFVEKMTWFRESLDAYVYEYVEQFPERVLSLNFAANKLCGINIYNDDILIKAIKACNNAVNHGDKSIKADFFSCAAVLTCKANSVFNSIFDSAVSRVFSDKKELYLNAIHSCALVTAISGFDYDKNTMAVTFSPNETAVDSEGMFKSFISFDGAYGIVEQGPDYLEIILYAGDVRIRKLYSKRRPYKVLYAGRIWPCDIVGNDVNLGTNLLVNKNKKLTVLTGISAADRRAELAERINFDEQ